MSTQAGTGSLTIQNPATVAAGYITVPSGAVVEKCQEIPGGSPIKDDFFNSAGRHHTRVTYEASMDGAVITLYGALYTKKAGEMDGPSSAFYVESCPRDSDKAPTRTVITVTRMPTITTTTSTSTTSTTGA